MKGLVLFGFVLTTFHQSSSHTLSEDASKSLTISTNTPLAATTSRPTSGNLNKYIFTESKAGHECLMELQLNEDLIKNAFQKDYKILEGKREVNEFMACVWKKYGYLDEDGTINKDGISTYVNYLSLRFHHLEDIGKRVKEIAKDCVQGAYEKDSAVKMYNCIVNHAYGDRHEPKNLFIIYMGEECSKDVDETIIKLINSSLRLPEGNDRINKYIDCVAKVYRYLSKDGKVIPDQVATLVEYILRSSRGIDNPDWIIYQTLQNCKAAQTSDPGETAIKSNNCIIDYITSHDRIKFSSRTLSEDASKSLATTTANTPLLATTNNRTNSNLNKYIFTESKAGHECLTELQLNLDLIKNAFQKDYKILEGNKQVNEFMACVWKKYGYLDEDGIINTEIAAYVNYLSLRHHHLEDFDKRVKDIAKDCTQGIYEKDSAVKMYNCIVNHAYGDRNEPKKLFIIYMGEECSKDLDETILKLMNSSLRFPEGNDRLNKYIDCVAKVYRYLSKEGKVIPDQVSTLVEYILRSSRGIDNPAWIIYQTLENCKATQASDPGETAVKSNNCIIDYITSHDRIKITNWPS